MTPQMRWILKMKAEGRCIRCGKPAAPRKLCPDHRQADAARKRRAAVQ